MSPSSDTIRSFALVGHSGAGKTHTADAIARLTGLNNRLGSPGEGTSLFDYEPEEQKRGGSISSHLLSCDYDGFRIHILDTPGDGNFLHDAQICLQGVDAAMLVISAVDGIEVSTERMSALAAEMGLPRAIFINKMDRERADYQHVLSELKEVLGVEPVLLQLPLGRETAFKGVIDLVDRKVWTYNGDGGAPTQGPIPEELEDEVEVAVESMVESVAMADDALVEKYLEEGELSSEELRNGLNKGITEGTLCPVLLGSAALNIGVDRMLWLARAFPGPSDREGFGAEDDTVVEANSAGGFAALCFKTVIDPFSGQISLFRVVRGATRADSTARNPRTGKDERLGTIFNLVGKKQVPLKSVQIGDLFGVSKLKDTKTGDTLCSAKQPVKVKAVTAPPPMISYTIRPKNRGEEDKIRSSLEKVLSEDPGLRLGYDEVTKEMVVSGMGANHIQLSVERMARKYGVGVELGTPTIPYREAIMGSADVRYRHKKQSGGAGQFGEVSIRVSPNERGEGFEFVNKVVGGVIPTQLIPSVEKGVRKKLNDGVIAGFPVVDIRVELYDGKSHPVDSKDIAFQIAGRQAVKEAVSKAQPTLLEPVYEMTIAVPEDTVGDIMGDMNGRRGRIVTMESKGRKSFVKVLVPLAEILNYAPNLNSMTGGKGSYTMQLSSYEPVPNHMLDSVLKEIRRVQDDDD